MHHQLKDLMTRDVKVIIPDLISADPAYHPGRPSGARSRTDGG